MTKEILNRKIQCYLMYLSVFYFYKWNDLPFRKAILSWVLLPIPLTVNYLSNQKGSSTPIEFLSLFVSTLSLIIY